MSITITIFGHVLQASDTRLLFVVTLLYLLDRVVRSGLNWIFNRYEIDRATRLPKRRWYAKGRTLTTRDGGRFYIHDFDRRPEGADQPWVLVSDLRDDAAPAGWRPTSTFLRPLDSLPAVPSR